MLDLEMRNFEDAFYDFRSRVKELDRRLSSLIIQGLDDCSGLANRFRLFDSFDLLLLRPIISEVRTHTTWSAAVCSERHYPCLWGVGG